MGGRFAYSTIEGHAYEMLTSIVQNDATSGAFLGTTVAPVSGNDPTSAYALESATLPKEHRGLPLTSRFAPLGTHHSYN